MHIIGTDLNMHMYMYICIVGLFDKLFESYIPVNSVVGLFAHLF